MCANESIQGFALYTGICLILRAGTLQMVSEHCVACRIETLGLVRNKKAHRTKRNLFAIHLKLFYVILVTS